MSGIARDEMCLCTWLGGVPTFSLRKAIHFYSLTFTAYASVKWECTYLPSVGYMNQQMNLKNTVEGKNEMQQWWFTSFTQLGFLRAENESNPSVPVP